MSFDELRKRALALRRAAAELDAALDATLRTIESERQPRDNGDGTVTQLLPVTYDAKWRGRVGEVRKPQRGSCFVSNFGDESTANGCERGVRLILSPPAPQPEPITWHTPLADGEWHIDSDGFARLQATAHCLTKEMTIAFCRAVMHGWIDPPKPGRYLFANGVGTWQGDA